MTENTWKHIQVLVSNEAADAQVLKPQAISIHNTDQCLFYENIFWRNGYSWCDYTWIKIQFQVKIKMNQPFKVNELGFIMTINWNKT